MGSFWKPPMVDIQGEHEDGTLASRTLHSAQGSLPDSLLSTTGSFLGPCTLKQCAAPNLQGNSCKGRSAQELQREALPPRADWIQTWLVSSPGPRVFKSSWAHCLNWGQIRTSALPTGSPGQYYRQV